jgi:plastocyanin
MTHPLRLVAASLAVALAAGACGSSATSSNTSTAGSAGAPAPVSTGVGSTPHPAAGASAKPISGHATIAIRNYKFTPMHLTVTAGTKVSFHNGDQTAHTATAVGKSFDSGTIQPGQTSTVTFAKAGTYAYDCLFHAFMTATITVVPAKH